MAKRKRQRLVVRHFHENGLKFVLENAANIRDLLTLLKVKLAARIDFSKMYVVPGRYVSRDYRHLESDLVLRAPVQSSQEDAPREIVVYILIEHQSEPDQFMALRLLEYLLLIYKRQMREWKTKHQTVDGFRLQPVLPIVMYTGTRTWDRLASLWETVDLGEELTERIPDLQPLFLNVGQTSEDVLQQGGAFGLLLRLVQHKRMRLSVFEKTLTEVVRVLDTLSESDRNRWEELLSYIMALIYNEREVGEQESLIKKAMHATKDGIRRQEISNMSKTAAQALIEMGRQEGKTAAQALIEKSRQEGIELGETNTRRVLLLRLLNKKFGKIPAATVKRIEGTERLDLLEAWFDQAVAAAKLDDISFSTKG